MKGIKYILIIFEIFIILSYIIIPPFYDTSRTAQVAEKYYDKPAEIRGKAMRESLAKDRNEVWKFLTILLVINTVSIIIVNRKIKNTT